MTAIERWARDYTAWKAWFAEWRNKRNKPRSEHVPGVRAPIRQTPCSGAPSRSVKLTARRCVPAARRMALERRRDRDPQTAGGGRADAKENDQKTVWWQHIHLDALWPMTQGTSGVYGILGLHTTIDLTGRVELFVAPGAILMRVPGPSGNGEWKPATDCRVSATASPISRCRG